MAVVGQVEAARQEDSPDPASPLPAVSSIDESLAHGETAQRAGDKLILHSKDRTSTALVAPESGADPVGTGLRGEEDGTDYAYATQPIQRPDGMSVELKARRRRQSGESPHEAAMPIDYWAASTGQTPVKPAVGLVGQVAKKSAGYGTVRQRGNALAQAAIFSQGVVDPGAPGMPPSAVGKQARASSQAYAQRLPM